MDYRRVYLTGPEQIELRYEPALAPGDGELVVSVEAATTCGTDLKVFLRGGHPRMLEIPTPFGHEVTGRVAAVGAGVSGWCEGDPVVVANSASCGDCAACRSGRENLCGDLAYLNGAFADRLVVPARFVARSTWRRPELSNPAVAALAEPFACVLHGLSRVESAGSTALVIGAGPIGLMFVAELARRGLHVVAADTVEVRLDTARRMGARSAVAVTAGPADAGELQSAFGGTGPELVIEATGSPLAWATALAVVATGGEVVLFGGCRPGTEVSLDAHRLHYSELTVRGVYHHRPETFAAALDRLAAGSPDLSPLLEAEYGLDGLETALRAMQERRLLKAVIRP